ncbi:hypothetical protein [Cyanobacterium aponinum]|uniref:Uncharacterized protein n=1 Tax=Cyanobacterium aponinum (strain PCC 10605) TaxID=755178 RepID=K9Z5M1_CYAAP|nr:hypothetical protein [Cyanobacterium aponinum]AFZ54486.1 hypothetical protein Cyan10605_2404 [Cyanobacterium aponinum PCC 10605]
MFFGKIFIVFSLLITFLFLLILLALFGFIDGSYINHQGLGWEQTGKPILFFIFICFLLLLLFFYV